MPSLENTGRRVSAESRLASAVLPVQSRPFTIINNGFPILICLSSLVSIAGLREARLEQFNRIAGRIVEQNLVAANASDDIVAEVNSLLAQLLDNSSEIGNLK